VIARGRGRRCADGLTAALLAALLGCGDGAAGAGAPGGAGAGPPPPVVEVLRVAPETVDNEVELLGQLEADESVMVRSEMSGVIERVEFEEGQQVSKGQLLFQLRDDEQVARLHEAQANLGLAEDAFRRTRGLAERKLVSEAEVEKTTAEVAAARARVEVAQVAFDRTRIRAPFDGLAGARLVSPGSRIQRRDDLVKVDAVASLQLVFTLPEQALPLARVGVPIELSVAPFPDEHFRGEVFFVAPSLNPSNRRLLVKARVPNPDLRLRPGLFASVQAHIGHHDGALMVPESAIVYGSDGPYVWRLAEGSVAETVDVELGLRQSGRVEIRSGLRPGDVVVVAGTNKLSPGLHVETASAASEGGAGAAPAAERGPAGPAREGAS
jgi:membrane fusion protein, multidrug efflux system